MLLASWPSRNLAYPPSDSPVLITQMTALVAYQIDMVDSTEDHNINRQDHTARDQPWVIRTRQPHRI